jgi:hypothetical protein
LFGFVHYCDDSFTTFSVPGGVTDAIQGTASFAINQEQLVTGIYIDSNSMLPGFLGAPNGPFIKLNAPGAGTGVFQGTRPKFVSPANVLVGYVTDRNGVGTALCGSRE